MRKMQGLTSILLTPVLLVMAVASGASAGHDMLRFGLEPGGARGGARFSSEYTTYAPADTDDPFDHTLGMSRLDTRVTFPRSISFTHTRFNLYSRAVLPRTGLRLPDGLERASVALARYRRLDNGLILGGRVALTSASDKLFHGPDETFLNGTLFVRKPSAGRNAWLFLLSASTRPETMVIPGVAYQWMKSRSLWGIVGPPFAMVHWEPREKWSMDVRVIMLRYSAAVTYRAHERAHLSLKIANEEIDFYRADRDDEDDAITYAEHNVKLELAWYPTPEEEGPAPSLRLNLSAGYAFEREIYEDDDDNNLDIDPGLFCTVALTIRF